MLAVSESDLQRMMDRLNMVSVNYNMKINTKKTKVMKISKATESAMKILAEGELLEQVMKIGAEGELIEQVKEFCYLGSMISADASCHREIKRRIAMGKEAFSTRKALLRGRLKRYLKKRMVKTQIWSVTLYYAET